MTEEKKTAKDQQEASQPSRFIDPKEPDPETKVGLSDDKDTFLQALGKKPKS